MTDDPRAGSDVLEALDRLADAVTVFLASGSAACDTGVVVTACGDFFLRARLADWPPERAIARAIAVTVDCAERIPTATTDVRYQWLRARIATWVISGYV